MATPTVNPLPPESALPPLPTPTTNQPELNKKISFDSPQNWGTPPAIQTPVALPTPNEDLTTSKPMSLVDDESPSLGIVKVFLISLGLILLGVLLGILAAKFFQPVSTSPVSTEPEISVIISEEITPEETPIMLPTPTATPEALLKLTWKSYSTATYKLFYPQNWTKKNTATGITLSKGSNSIVISTTKSESTCLKDPQNTSLQSFDKDGNFWVLQEASASSVYQICEYTDSDPIPDTQIGTITLSGTKIDQATLDEFKYIVEKIEIVRKNISSYSCPTSDYVDCMPTVGGVEKTECSVAAMTWYKANCPNFKGAAL